jgi:hypothetical protein
MVPAPHHGSSSLTTAALNVGIRGSPVGSSASLSGAMRSTLRVPVLLLRAWALLSQDSWNLNGRGTAGGGPLRTISYRHCCHGTCSASSLTTAALDGGFRGSPVGSSASLSGAMRSTLRVPVLPLRAWELLSQDSWNLNGRGTAGGGPLRTILYRHSCHSTCSAPWFVFVNHCCLEWRNPRLTCWIKCFSFRRDEKHPL